MNTVKFAHRIAGRGWIAELIRNLIRCGLGSRRESRLSRTPFKTTESCLGNGVSLSTRFNMTGCQIGFLGLMFMISNAEGSGQPKGEMNYLSSWEFAGCPGFVLDGPH